MLPDKPPIVATLDAEVSQTSPHVCACPPSHRLAREVGTGLILVLVAILAALVVYVLWTTLRDGVVGF